MIWRNAAVAGAILVAIAASGLLLTPGTAQKAPEASVLPGAKPCLDCHEEGRRTGKREPGMPPAFDAPSLRASPHATLECNACHSDLAGKELPHEDKLAPVDCGSCHPDQSEQYDASLHGRAAKRGDKLAPSCKGCHGTHNILRSSDRKSRTSTMEIPRLCGQCHREGSAVSLTHDIPQQNILANYADSIHGEGLFKRGLTVTAVCTSCHTSHFVLPHTDPRSSIAKNTIAKTCTKCHAQIETVHQKVIRGELWEKAPNAIPACVDCHEPHKVRRVFYSQGMADRDCMVCHGDPNLKSVTGKPIARHIDRNELANSRHAKVACVQCHTGGNVAKTRPCETMPPKVDCSICHADQVNQYRESRHGTLAAQNSPDAPQCKDCHGTHGILGKLNPSAPTFSRNVPALCGGCHRTGQKAALRYTGTQKNIAEHYAESIHGKGLLQSGLTVTADCADCHTAHRELPSKDPRSTVNRQNVAKTCAQCHRGIYDQYSRSVHSPTFTKTDKKLPECSDCHSAHSIGRTDSTDFRLHIMDQCGQCHKEITERYFETFHGKVSNLGYLKTAKCYDCHGAHDILPVTNPASHLSRNNIVKTCGQCHTGSHRQFAGYLTHATHHDPERYPFLFYTFWGMTSLLVGTLFLSGVHTALWLPRSLQYRKQLGAAVAHEGAQPFVRRFQPFQRNLHLMVISSFLGLAVTGMILKFSYAGWASFLARLFGGFESAGYIHRFCAIVTFTYFGLHLYDLYRRRRTSGKSWLQFILSPDGIMFNRRDLTEFVESMKWFVGKGDRPQYGRWTYWEKFDYFAVFWGVAVIGSSGLMLWFPEFFTRFMPGWAINVATTIHSDEALLATAFIFTVHFFNTHFRPEKFPMDTVIFTGGMPLEEFKKDRPREYQELVEKGELEKYFMPAPEAPQTRFWRRLGFTALAIGLSLIALIIYAVFYAYR
jgi:cytochrome b subunit of formate dehydrogenase